MAVRLLYMSRVFYTYPSPAEDLCGKLAGCCNFARDDVSVVVDEAHVVSHWGSGFRKKYGSLGILRALLPKGTPFVAMSATLPPRVRNDVLNKLQFDKNKYVNINLGNEVTSTSSFQLVLPSLAKYPKHSSQSFREAGIIRPYSAAFSPEYRANVMALFKAGVVWISYSGMQHI